MSYKKAKIVAAVIGLLYLLAFIFGWWAARQVENPEPAPVQTIPTTTTATTITTAEPTEPAEQSKMPHFPLTDWERDLVERVVMGEAGGESFEGQMAVAQCILNTSNLRRLSPTQVVVELKYTKARPNPTESVKQAVAAVFDEGETVLDHDVIYFYAPALTRSTWHESQEYATTIGCHKFFKEVE